MNIELIDQIPSALEGAPPKYLGLRDDGAFGFVKVEASLVQINARTMKMPNPMLLSEVIGLARAVLRGDARAITAPGTSTGLAIAVLAVAAQLGRTSMQLEQLALEFRELEERAAETDSDTPRESA